MTDTGTTQQGAGLPAQISQSLELVWTRHSGRRPRAVETAIRGNVVICDVRGGAVEFSEGMLEPAASTPPESAEDDGASSYSTDAVAVVGRLTRQRVRLLASTLDREADVATERFVLEPSLLNGGTPR